MYRYQNNDTKPIQIPSIVHSVLRSSGNPIDDSTRAFVEDRFGRDFRSVRLHADAEAAEAARAVNALAFTVGRDVVFGAGQYEPRTYSGQLLLAHELVHVIQQTMNPYSSDPHASFGISHPNDIYETEAGRVAKQVVTIGAPLGQMVQQTTRGLLFRANAQEAAAVLGRKAIVGVQFFPAAVAGTRVGPVSGLGGLARDVSPSRLSVIIGRGTTLRDLAGILLNLWNTATPFTPPGTNLPVPLVPLDRDTLARGLLVYNQYYLPAPVMTRWKVGLYFPLPIELDTTTNEGVLHPDVVRNLATAFDPSWESLLDQFPSVPGQPTAQELRQSVASFLTASTTTLSRGMQLATRAITNPLAERGFVLEAFNQIGTDAFAVALSFMDNMVNHEVASLASQRAGADILDRIRTILASAPTSLSGAEQNSLTRANGMLGRVTRIAPHAAPYVLPDATRPFDLNRQTDIALFAMNLWSEAWTEVAHYGRRSLQAVAQVVLNRVTCGFAGSPRDVILARLQFSWTSPSNSVYTRAFEPVRNSNELVWLQCLDVATEALSGGMANPGVDNADHYYNPAAANPAWATPETFVAAIGNHRFHRRRCPPP